MAVYFTYLCLLVLKIEAAWPSSWHLQQQRIMGATFSKAESESDSYEMFVHNIALGRIMKCFSGLNKITLGSNLGTLVCDIRQGPSMGKREVSTPWPTSLHLLSCSKGMHNDYNPTDISWRYASIVFGLSFFFFCTLKLNIG